VICWFAEFWSTNICYCLFSATQNQFIAEKKNFNGQCFFLTNKKFLFTVKRKGTKYVLRNIRNHRMTYIRHWFLHTWAVLKSLETHSVMLALYPIFEKHTVPTQAIPTVPPAPAWYVINANRFGVSPVVGMKLSRRSLKLRNVSENVTRYSKANCV
jgi:hypothetical protein